MCETHLKKFQYSKEVQSECESQWDTTWNKFCVVPFSSFCGELKVKNHFLLLPYIGHCTTNKIIKNRTEDPINIFNARSSPICSYVSTTSSILHLQSLMTLSDKLVLPFHLPIKAQPPLVSIHINSSKSSFPSSFFPCKQAHWMKKKKRKSHKRKRKKPLQVIINPIIYYSFVFRQKASIKAPLFMTN